MTDPIFANPIALFNLQYNISRDWEILIMKAAMGELFANVFFDPKTSFDLLSLALESLGKTVKYMHETYGSHGDLHFYNMFYEASNNSFQIIDFDDLGGSNKKEDVDKIQINITVRCRETHHTIKSGFPQLLGFSVLEDGVVCLPISNFIIQH